MSVRCLELDLDSTLLGKAGSLLHDGEGAVSIEGVRAVQACLRRGWRCRWRPAAAACRWRRTRACWARAETSTRRGRASCSTGRSTG